MAFWIEQLVEVAYPLVTPLGVACLASFYSVKLEEEETHAMTNRIGSEFESHAEEAKYLSPLLYRISEDIAFGYLSFDVWAFEKCSTFSYVKLSVIILLFHLGYLFFRRNRTSERMGKVLIWWNVINIFSIIFMRFCLL